MDHKPAPYPLPDAVVSTEDRTRSEQSLGGAVRRLRIIRGARLGLS